jgi:flavorubredoxin
METKVDEIADGIYRLSTFVPDVGMSFNQFLIDAEEPLLFHTGLRGLFPLVSEAVARVRPVEDLRWITFGHFEADECGSMNEWLDVAPDARVAHGAIGVMVSLNDTAERPPVVLADDEVLDLGGKRVRHLDTPHVPHGWDAGLFYEETTGTLLAGDLFTHLGDGPALVETDVVGPAVEAESMFRSMTLAPQTRPTLERLAGLEPTTLALMHGSSYRGDGGAMLGGLADALDATFTDAR